MMDKLEATSQKLRRARTKSLIQLGALVEKVGLLETFGVTLGLDLQRDSLMKNPVAALYQGLLELNATAQSGEIHMQTYAQQGLEELRKLKERKSNLGTSFSEPPRGKS